MVQHKLRPHVETFEHKFHWWHAVKLPHGCFISLSLSLPYIKQLLYTLSHSLANNNANGNETRWASILTDGDDEETPPIEAATLPMGADSS